ncbi:hypothetical protein DRO26_00220 [Candidatus Bathyarchaeota archaeon]|nr:MAG: hypothetical protein DRO26_00220 [Candidatus Bathyarchaeota archaeon]
MTFLPLKKIENKPIPLPKVKEILENLGKELNQFQRKTLEYALTFSKLKGDKAEELCEKLTKNFGLSMSEAVQIVNCMPETAEELKVFFPRHKVIEPEKLREIIKLLDEYR